MASGGMMKIKIKSKAIGRFITVEVIDKECKKYKCFVWGTYTHRTACGMSGCSAQTANGYSCLTRDNHGCPDKKEKK